MYISLKNFLLCMLKSLLLISFFVGVYFLVVLDYNLGLEYCSLMNIPKDLAFTIVSPGMAIDVCVVLFILELVCFYFIIKFLRRNNYINDFFESLNLD